MFRLPSLEAKNPFLTSLWPPFLSLIGNEMRFSRLSLANKCLFLSGIGKDGNENKIWAFDKEEREGLFDWHDHCWWQLLYISSHFTKYMHVCHPLPFTLMFKKYKSPVLAWLWWRWYFHVLLMNMQMGTNCHWKKSVWQDVKSHIFMVWFKNLTPLSLSCGNNPNNSNNLNVCVV